MEAQKVSPAMVKGGPDQGWAWVVAVACFVINFIMAGLARTAGVLYVALIDTYGVSREAATTPFSIRVCVRNMTGPLIGYLGQRYGIRPITAIGSVVAAAGGMLCYLAPNVFWITIFWGVIHGIGFGLSTILHMISINQYFDKYKASAMGFGYSGDCVGTFVFPVVLEVLLENYGVKGTFLIVGAIVLNVLPMSLLLKTPPWIEEAETLSKAKQISDPKAKNEKTPTDCGDSTEELVFNQRKIWGYYPYIVSDICRGLPVQLINLTRKLSVQQSDRTASFIAPSAEHDKESCVKEPNSEQTIPPGGQNLGELKEFEAQQENPNDESKPPYRMYIIESHHTILCPDQSPLSVSYTNNGYVSSSMSVHQAGKTDDISLQGCNILTDKRITNMEVRNVRSHSESVSSYKSLALKSPAIQSDSLQTSSIFVTIGSVVTNIMFNLIGLTMGMYAFLFVTVLTIIIDFGLDRGISQEQGKYLVIGLSAADLVGRLSFGGIMDRKLLSLHYYAMLTVTAMSAFVAVIPFCPGFATLMGVLVSYGLIQGGTAIMFPILIGNYMKKNEESIAMGAMNFYGGVLMLGMAPMIGYFRDRYGSYDGIFFIIGGITALTGCLWLLEPLIVGRKRKNFREGSGIPPAVSSPSEKA